MNVTPMTVIRDFRSPIPEDTEKKTNLLPEEEKKENSLLPEEEKKETSLLPRDEDTAEISILAESFTFLESLKSSSKDKTSQSAGKDFKMKTSAPDDSVGQLASELARSETKLDVQQVSSKATRALMSLKMASTACEEGDKKKIAQQIRRMEKLIKRIQKKLKHLSKEEQLEERQKKAIKQEELKEAELIQKELQTRRNKRHRDERNYALKEMAQDGQSEAKDMLAAVTPLVSDSMAVADFSAVEGISIDLSV